VKPFQVVIPDPWSLLRPTKKPESVHPNREAAEARGREIVVEELQRRFGQTGSWTKALRGYLDGRTMVRVECAGEVVADFRAFARAWVRERLAQDWPAVLGRIIGATPEVPRGWFRWLHHTFHSRYPARVNLALAEEWRAVNDRAASDPRAMDGVVAVNVAAHAWEIGCLGLRPLARCCWDRIPPGAKGLLVAGFSNRPGMGRWILARLPESTLTAEGVLEIACNAASQGDYPLFQEVLEKNPQTLRQEVERFEPPGTRPSRKSRWAKDVARLSHRVVDMALEACLLRGWLPGTRLALRLGARADLPFWVFERSFNEHHTALSYALKVRKTAIAEALLEAGARPGAHGDGRPLYLAITTGNDELAERLIADGMDFGPGDKPAWLAASRPGDRIAWERATSFAFLPQDITRAQKLGDGLPLVHPSETAWFYCGDGQGGCFRTVLSHFFLADDAERLQRYLRKGLPLRVTLPDLATLLASGASDCLRVLLREWQTAPAVRRRIRREFPDNRPAARTGRIKDNSKVREDDDI
jgi:hypothetical protein